MIKPSTILWIALAGAVGVGTYQLKHRMLAFEDELARIHRQVTAEQQAIHVLRAEWAYITQPQRLQPLANRHLDMNAMTPAQIGRVADLPARPPAPPEPAAPPIPPVTMAGTPAAGPTVQTAIAQPAPSAPTEIPAAAIAPVVAVMPAQPASARRPEPRGGSPARTNAPPRNDPIGALLTQMSTAATQHANNVRSARGAPPR